MTKLKTDSGKIIIDRWEYGIGDEVIAKHPSRDYNFDKYGIDLTQPQTISEVKMVEGIDMVFQILYFKSNPNTFFTANDFKPYGKTKEALDKLISEGKIVDSKFDAKQLSKPKRAAMEVKLNISQ